MKKSVLKFLLIGSLLSSPAVAQDVRNDFSGTWVNSVGTRFVIHQYGEQGAAVMNLGRPGKERNANFWIEFGAGEIPSSLQNELSDRSIRSQSLNNVFQGGSYDVRLGVTEQLSTVIGRAEFAVTLPSGFGDVSFLTQAAVKAVVHKKDDALKRCEGYTKPRALTVFVSAFAPQPDEGEAQISPDLLAGVKRFLKNLGWSTIIKRLSYSDTLMEVLPHGFMPNSTETDARCAQIEGESAPKGSVPNGEHLVGPSLTEIEGAIFR